MSPIPIGENLESSFIYAVNNTVRSLGKWTVLFLLTLIPIVNFIALGVYLRTIRNEEPDFSDAGRSFVEGTFCFLACLIYYIVPIILIIASPIVMIVQGEGGLTVLSIIMLVVGLLLLIPIILITMPAIVRFARTGRFIEAFNFKGIFEMIMNVGFGHYIFSFIVIFLVYMLISMLLSFILGFPIIGFGFYIIFAAIFAPFLAFLVFKYFANLFEDA